MLNVVKRGTKFQLLLKMFERLRELLFVQQRVAHRLLSKHHQKTVLQLLCYLQRWPEESQRSIVLALVHLRPAGPTRRLDTFARKVVCLKEGECFLSLRHPFIDITFLFVQARQAKQSQSEERRVGKECRSRWSP